MTLEAGWHPVALAADLDPGTATGTRLFGREIVVWRDAGGEAHVWEDRCPHRGMRLSFGFVRGDRLACLYHGWQFDGAARCRFIPAHPKLDVPETITVSTYACVERRGVVWACLGAAEAAGPPPDDDPGVMAVRSITILAPEARVMDALAAACGPFQTDVPLVVLRKAALVSAPDEGFFVALQPLSADETCLHVVVGALAAGERGARSRDPAALRAPLSTWAEALRRQAEAGTAVLGRVA